MTPDQKRDRTKILAMYHQWYLEGVPRWEAEHAARINREAAEVLAAEHDRAVFELDPDKTGDYDLRHVVELVIFAKPDGLFHLGVDAGTVRTRRDWRGYSPRIGGYEAGVTEKNGAMVYVPVESVAYIQFADGSQLTPPRRRY